MSDRSFAACFVIVTAAVGVCWYRSDELPWLFRVALFGAVLWGMHHWLRMRMATGRAEERSWWRSEQALLDEFISYGVFLHGDWKYLNDKCPTEVREAAADAVDRWRLHDDESERFEPVDRWWR